jgi:hypothetical protein
MTRFSVSNIGMYLCVALLALNLGACGNKGKLKTPSQMAAQQAKKARKQAQQQPDENADGERQEDAQKPAQAAPSPDEETK